MLTRNLLPAACCVFLAGSSLSIAADIVSLDGKTVKGAVVGVDGDSLTYKGEDGMPAKVSVKALAEVNLGNPTLPLPSEAYDEIELSDGSVLKVVNKGVKLKDRTLAVTPAAAPEGGTAPAFTLSLDHVFHWVRKANTGSVRADWKLKVVEKRGKRDLFVLYNEVDGFQPLEGTVIGGSEDGTAVTFVDADGVEQQYPLTRVSGGLVFYHRPPDVLPPTAGRVYDVYGNNLLATAVAITPKDGKETVTVTTVSGAVIEYPSLAAISRMDFSQGNVKYLAELDPTVDAPPTVTGVPFQPFLANKTQDGSGLRVGGKTYPKGVWVGPDSTLTYPLNGNYREFKAVVGIDDAVPVVTSPVTVVVEVDGRQLVEQTFTNAAKEKKPLELNLNVKDARSLKISVRREALFSGEGICFADAKLQK